MSDLLGEDAPDVEDFVCVWLGVVVPASVTRTLNDPLPFCVVQRVAGEDDPNEGIDDPAVQVDIFDRARDGMTAEQAAKKTANMVHRRMNKLARQPDTTIVLSDGTTANIDFMLRSSKPTRMEYADNQIVRYVGRYYPGLSFVAVK